MVRKGQVLNNLLFMKYNYFIGVDISKKTLDCTLLKGHEFVEHKKIANTKGEIGKWLASIMTEHRAGGKKTLFCAEHMGTYGRTLVNVITGKKLHLWLPSAYHIKHSLGLQRGKSDKIDSIKIAQFAQANQTKVRLHMKARPVIEELKALRSIRDRIKDSIIKLGQALKEEKDFVAKGVLKRLTEFTKESSKALKEDLKKTEQQILTLVQNDKHLKALFDFTTSVPGIGKVLATEILIATNEFKNFDSPRKFACYCGIAPFTYSSGTSLMTRAKVSHKANKRLKALLHMSVVSALRHSSEFKDYFKRKKAEGKHGWSIMNALKNKIVHRVFACVRDGREYSVNHSTEAHC